VGAVAVGLIDDWGAARALSRIDAVFEPDARRHDRAREGYERFVDIYTRLRTWFR
jgi:hypothetical protein